MIGFASLTWKFAVKYDLLITERPSKDSMNIEHFLNKSVRDFAIWGHTSALLKSNNWLECDQPMKQSDGPKEESLIRTEQRSFLHSICNNCQLLLRQLKQGKKATAVSC